MKIKITKSIIGTANAQGSHTKMYALGEEFVATEEWQIKLAHQFMDAGCAEEVKTVEPTETKKVRARTKKGRYVADDKSTPDVNEAYTTKRVKKKKT